MDVGESIERGESGGQKSPAAGGPRSPRVPNSQLGESTKARLLPGGEVDVLNISATGLLVEGRARPTVDTIVSIRLQGCNLRRLDGRIVRSRVSTIHRDGTLSYESAIEFDRPHAVEEMLSTGVTGGGLDVAAGQSDDSVYVLDADNDW